MTREEAEMKETSWKQWLESNEGKRALEPSILKPGNEEYLKNRLWWAFHAGNHPLTTKLPEKGIELLRQAIGKKYISKNLHRQIESYLRSITTPGG